MFSVFKITVVDYKVSVFMNLSFELCKMKALTTEVNARFKILSVDNVISERH